MAKFDIFLSQLKETNATLGFFTDFSKVSSSVAKIAVKLNQLNYLLGKDNLHAAVLYVAVEDAASCSLLTENLEQLRHVGALCLRLCYAVV